MAGPTEGDAQHGATHPAVSVARHHHSIRIAHDLPCGHRLEQSAAIDADVATLTYEAMLVMTERLSWWLNDRIKRHECALVSAENPSGKGPRTKG